MRTTIAIGVIALATGLGACGSTTGSTKVVARVAEHAFEDGGLDIGSPLAGAELRLYVGDTVVLATWLGPDGTAAISPEPGVYTVQVDLPAETDCFWGETLFEVTFPAERVELRASYICPGGGS
jgi:hypothetical protein